jgi:NADH-quinone oxidoreductase subunit D
MCELNRIASHALSYGTFGMDVGAMTPIFYCFQAREKILDLYEAACGARLLYNYFVVGGITRDLPSGWVQKCKDLCDDLEKNFLPQHENFLIRNSIYYARTMHIGVITPDMAERHGITGPNLRGSGMKWDLRRNYPYDPERRGTYSVYKDLEFDIPVGNACDGQGIQGSCWDRMMVRFKEMKESVKIVRQALDKLPHGGVQNLPMPRKLTPNGQVYLATEAARGELGIRLIADGTDKPYRLHVNSPGFNVIYALPELCRDILVADLIAVVGSVDFVMGEVGR